MCIDGSCLIQTKELCDDHADCPFGIDEDLTQCSAINSKCFIQVPWHSQMNSLSSYSDFDEAHNLFKILC